MLTGLDIENIAVIKCVDFEFDKGFSVRVPHANLSAKVRLSARYPRHFFARTLTISLRIAVSIPTKEILL